MSLAIVNKRIQLLEKKSDLEQEIDATHDQLIITLDSRVKISLKHELNQLLSQYEQVNREIAELWQGDSVQVTTQELLLEQSAALEPASADEREQVREALRAAGLLTELSLEEKERARSSTATLEEVRAALDRAGGPPLSELVLEMRGPKD